MSLARPAITPQEHAVEWREVDGQSRLDPDTVRLCVPRLDRALAEVVSRSALLADAAADCVLFLDSERVPGELAYACPFVPEGGALVPAVGVYAGSCLLMSDQQLVYALAHELMHVALGHVHNSIPGGDEGAPATVRYMIALAEEPLVCDHLTAEGFERTLDTPNGTEVFGFSLVGLVRREVWDMVNGTLSRRELHELARARGGRLTADFGWGVEVLTPSAAALRFWSRRRGPWSRAWDRPHRRLVARSRGR